MSTPATRTQAALRAAMAAVVFLILASSASAAPAQRTERAVAHPTFYRTVEVDGLSIFYREAGPKDAPTLLLLHHTDRIEALIVQDGPRRQRKHAARQSPVSGDDADPPRRERPRRLPLRPGSLDR